MDEPQPDRERGWDSYCGSTDRCLEHGNANECCQYVSGC